MAAPSPSLTRFNWRIYSATTHKLLEAGPDEGYDNLRMARIVGAQKLRDMIYNCFEPGCESGCCCYMLRFCCSLHAPYGQWERYIL